MNRAPSIMLRLASVAALGPAAPWAQISYISVTDNNGGTLYEGDTATAVVHLDHTSFGETVNLTSSNPSVAPVPASIFISHGNSQGSFSIHLGQVDHSQGFSDAKITGYENPSVLTSVLIRVFAKPTCTPPSIPLTQPLDTSTASGGMAILSVNPTGTPPLSFQWFLNSGPAPSDAHTNVYQTPPLTATSTAYVIVSNQCGSPRSRTATVTVKPACTPPSIPPDQPGDLTINSGDPVTVGVAATGTSLEYKWYQNDVVVQDGPLYFYNSSPLFEDATFKVVASNDCGSEPSRTAQISVNNTCPISPIATSAAYSPRLLSRAAAASRACVSTCPVNDPPAIWPFPQRQLHCPAPTESCLDYAGMAPPNTISPCLLDRTTPDARGISFEVWCATFTSPDPECHDCFGFYRNLQGNRQLVGKCWFTGGQNDVAVMYSSQHVTNSGENVTPACYTASTWTNRQVYRTDADCGEVDCAADPPLPNEPPGLWHPADGKLDTWIYDFAVDPNKLTVSVFKDFDEVFHRDPSSGSSFNSIPPIISSVPAVDHFGKVVRSSNLLCDLNKDGKCDAADMIIFQAALGSCIGNAHYNFAADINHDGCVTADDQRLLFPLPADVNRDGAIDCKDLNIVRASFGKTASQPGFDPRADINADKVVDIRDLAFVAQRLPAGTRCQ